MPTLILEDHGPWHDESEGTKGRHKQELSGGRRRRECTGLLNRHLFWDEKERRAYLESLEALLKKS